MLNVATKRGLELFNPPIIVSDTKDSIGKER